MDKLNWSNLPSEILNIIFLYLKKSDRSVNQKKDLSQCVLTCRGWRDASQVIFFSDINLHSKNDISKLFHLLLLNNKLGTLIKTLSFSGNLTNYPIDITILFALNSHFPNLESLNFSGDNLFYSSFAKMVTENGNFRSLRSLPVPTNTVQDQMYLQCVNFLKDRVKTIELFDDHTKNRNNYSDLRERLNNFPDLEEIIIHTAASDMSAQTYYMKYLEDFAVDKSKSLKKLSITTSVNGNNSFQLFASGQQETLHATTKLKGVHIIINSNACALPSKNFMLFIMNRFPEINNFRLENVFQTCQNLEVPSSANVTALLPFLKYLSAMPNYSLQNIVLLNESVTKLIKELYTAPEVEAASTKLLRCLHVKQNFYDNYHSSYYNAPLTSYTIVSFENISSRKQNIKVTLKNSRTYNHCYGSLQPQNTTSYEELIQQVGCFFEMINLEIDPNIHSFDQLLNCVVTYCTQLNDLVISGHKSLSEGSSLFKKELTNSCNIKRLTLLGFTPTQEQLINLLNQLPNLEMLTLTNWFLKNSNSPHKSFSSDFCLPNASLKCLEINMDNSFSGLPKSNVYYIKVITDNPSQEAVRFSLMINCSNSGIKGYHVEENITESIYQRSIGDPESSTCLVYCKSLEKLTIRYIEAENGHYYKKVDLLLSA